MRFKIPPLVVVAILFPALASAEDKPANREEALAACLKGCTVRIKQTGTLTPPQQAICDETCGCIIGAMFEPSGKRKRDPSELGAVSAECIARLQSRVAEPASTFVRPPDGQPSIDWQRELMTGHGCKKGKVPGLHYDDRQNAVALDGGGFALRVPKGWHVASERPNLMLAWTAARADGVRPVFEVFVTPKCKQVDAIVAIERVAARALAGLAPSDAIIEQVAKGKWSGGLGGPVGTSLVFFHVGLKTPQGERTMVLYFTDAGDGKTFTIRAAAGCPREVATGQGFGPCEQTYFDMLKTGAE